MEIALDRTVVVITGAGGGLGRAYAHELARRGARLVVNDVDRAAAAAVVDAIRAAGGTADASDASVATAEGGRAIIESAVERFGTVHAVVHNAGVWRHVPYEEMTPEQLDPVLDVHLRGAFFVTQPAWTIMRRRGYGRIVLTSSGAGAFGREFGANYAAAKAGILGLGRSLALEGADHGILTNCVLPVAPFVRPRPSDGPTVPKEIVRRFVETGLPPTVRPELVAPLVAYLVSPACDRNGAAFSAGGGRFAEVVTALTRGWVAPTAVSGSAEAIADHMDEIEDRADVTVPGSVWEELSDLARVVAERDVDSSR